MVKGSGHRKSESALAPSRDSGDAIAKTLSSGAPNVRRNCPWTEAEHKLFLLGLEEYGRGNWRDIAARYVSTRTPTQVASHAQKYFLREGLPPSRREKRRPSIHDIRSATEVPVMSADERFKLRNSLQVINRESMESIDTSAGGGRQPGLRHSMSAFPRNYSRSYTVEAGNSGEASTGGGDRNAYTSMGESISEEELWLRTSSQTQLHTTSSDGFAESLPEDEQAKPKETSLGPPESFASWRSSALFAPAQLPPQEKSRGTPLQGAAQEPSVCKQPSFEAKPNQNLGMVYFSGPVHEGMRLPESGMQGMLPQGTLQGNAVVYGGVPQQQQPPDARAIRSYPIRSSFSDQPNSSFYNDGIAVPDLHAGAGFAHQYGGWAGVGAYGIHGRVSLGCQSGAGQSNSAYGSDCDFQRTNGAGVPRVHSDIALQANAPVPSMQVQNMYMLPSGSLDRPLDPDCVAAGIEFFGPSSAPMVLANSPHQHCPQHNFSNGAINAATGAQPQAPSQQQAFANSDHLGEGEAFPPANCCPSVEDFRGLNLSAGREELFMPTWDGQDPDPLLASMRDLDQVML